MSSATPASASHTADNGVAGTAAFSKFMRVLQWVADNPEPVGIAEIAKATGFPRPTVHDRGGADGRAAAGGDRRDPQLDAGPSPGATGQPQLEPLGLAARATPARAA